MEGYSIEIQRGDPQYQSRRFVVGCKTYVAEYIHPNPEALDATVHEGEWRLSMLSWHTHRNHKPIKAKVQQPRFKTMGFFPSIEACESFLKK